MHMYYLHNQFPLNYLYFLKLRVTPYCLFWFWYNTNWWLSLHQACFLYQVFISQQDDLLMLSCATYSTHFFMWSWARWCPVLTNPYYSVILCRRPLVSCIHYKHFPSLLSINSKIIKQRILSAFSFPPITADGGMTERVCTACYVLTVRAVTVFPTEQFLFL